MFVLDYAQESYSQILAIGNFIAFAGLIGCCVLFYLATVVGQLDGYYKKTAVSTMIYIVVILIAHCLLVDNYGITLLVPPIGTPYFADFMHVMQYLASVSIIIMFCVLIMLGVMRGIGYIYKGQPLSAWIYLIIMFVLHGYIYDSYGILLIFPPTLW